MNIDFDGVPQVVQDRLLLWSFVHCMDRVGSRRISPVLASDNYALQFLQTGAGLSGSLRIISGKVSKLQWADLDQALSEYRLSISQGSVRVGSTGQMSIQFLWQLDAVQELWGPGRWQFLCMMAERRQYSCGVIWTPCLTGVDLTPAPGTDLDVYRRALQEFPVPRTRIQSKNQFNQHISWEDIDALYKRTHYLMCNVIFRDENS